MLEESTGDGGVILAVDAVVAGIVLDSVLKVSICDADDANDVGNNVVASVAGVTNGIVVVEVVDVLVVDVAEVLLDAGVAEVLLDAGVAEVLLDVDVAVVLLDAGVAVVLLDVDVAVVMLVVGVAVVLLVVNVAVLLVVVEVAVVVDLVAVTVVMVVCVVEETVCVVVASLQTQDFSMVTELFVHTPLHNELHAALAGGVLATDFTFAYRLHTLSSSRSFNAVVLGLFQESIQLSSE